MKSRSSQLPFGIENITLFVCVVLSVTLMVLPETARVVVADRLGLVLTATLLAAVFRQRSFCNYLCPVSGFLSLYAMAAVVEVRTKLVNAARGIAKSMGERLGRCDADRVGPRRELHRCRRVDRGPAVGVDRQAAAAKSGRPSPFMSPSGASAWPSSLPGVPSRVYSTPPFDPDHTRTIPLPQLFRLLMEILHDTAQLDFMVALGTHPPLSPEQAPL